MTHRRSVILGAAALPLAAPALAQARPLRIIVPFPPGGAVDLLGRILAERLPPALGTGVVVENRGGAGGMIGADALAKGDRDGTMVGLLGVAILCAFPFMTQRLPFNPRTDFTPVTQITDGALLCVVNAETARRNGWTDLRSLVAWSKRNPDQVKMGSSGTGTTSHINIEAINAASGAKILHVPYRGGGPATQDTVAGVVDFYVSTWPGVVALVREGRLRALSIGAAQRVPGFPDLPTTAEAEVPFMAVDAWFGLFAPRGVEAARVTRLSEAFLAALAQPETAERATQAGLNAAPMGPGDFAAFQVAEVRRWQEMATLTGIMME